MIKKGSHSKGTYKSRITAALGGRNLRLDAPRRRIVNNLSEDSDESGIEDPQSGSSQDSWRCASEISKEPKARQPLNGKALNVLKDVTDNFRLTFKKIEKRKELASSPLKHFNKEEIIHHIRVQR